MKRWLINSSAGLAGFALGWVVRSNLSGPALSTHWDSPPSAAAPKPPDLGANRKPLAAAAGTSVLGFEDRVHTEFAPGQPMDAIRLRLFIQEWLTAHPAEAIRFFSQPAGALASQAPFFMQILTRHDATLAVETLLQWPDPLRGKMLHGTSATAACTRVLGETAPEKWLARLPEMERELRSNGPGGGFLTSFFRGWASRDALAALTASLQYPTQPNLYLVCEGVPPAQRRAVLDWAMTIAPAEANQIITAMANSYAKQDPDGARVFHESLPDALANDPRILERLAQGIVGSFGAAGTVDIAGIPTALRWIDQAFPLGTQPREDVLDSLSAQLTEEPGGVQALISQTNDEQWPKREARTLQVIKRYGGIDPTKMYTWLKTLDGPSRSAQLGAVWATVAPDELVAVAAAHPEDTGLAKAAVEAANALGVREDLLAEHPELTR